MLSPCTRYPLYAPSTRARYAPPKPGICEPARIEEQSREKEQVNQKQMLDVVFINAVQDSQEQPSHIKK